MSNVEVITLSEVLSKYVGDDDRPLLLKIDCEGCEYDVILNDYENVRKFDELVVEYHAYVAGKPITWLLNALGRDFNCNLINGEFFEKYSPYPRNMQGIIKCTKRT